MDRGELIKKLFLAALAQQRERRSSFLATGCAGQDSLRREIEGLLADMSTSAACLNREP
jgi:hypothetical protein